MGITVIEIVAEMNEEYQDLFFKSLKEKPNEAVKMLQATIDMMRIFDPEEYKRLYKIFHKPESDPACFSG